MGRVIVATEGVKDRKQETVRGSWLLVVSGVNRIYSLRQMLSSSLSAADHVKGLNPR